MVNSFCTKIATTHLKPHLLQKAHHQKKTQLNVENEFISSEISQNKESAVERGSKIIIVKKNSVRG